MLLCNCCQSYFFCCPFIRNANHFIAICKNVEKKMFAFVLQQAYILLSAFCFSLQVNKCAKGYKRKNGKKLERNIKCENHLQCRGRQTTHKTLFFSCSLKMNAAIIVYYCFEIEREENGFANGVH